MSLARSDPRGYDSEHLKKFARVSQEVHVIGRDSIWMKVHHVVSNPADLAEPLCTFRTCQVVAESSPIGWLIKQANILPKSQIRDVLYFPVRVIRIAIGLKFFKREFAINQSPQMVLNLREQQKRFREIAELTANIVGSNKSDDLILVVPDEHDIPLCYTPNRFEEMCFGAYYDAVCIISWATQQGSHWCGDSSNLLRNYWGRKVGSILLTGRLPNSF